MMNRRRYAFLALLIVCCFTPVFRSDAATLTVNAATPYVAADGLCSLIEAIDNANDDAATHADCTAGAGADTIILTDNVTLDGTATFNVNGATGLPAITTPITIEGGGFAIARDPAAPAFRILAVGGTGNLTLNRVTIQNGLLNAGFTEGGGIYTQGDLTLTESVVRDNIVAGIFPSGGGISGENTSTITLINTVVQNNVADNGDPAQVFDNGGGIYAGGDLTLRNASILDNRAAENAGGFIAFANLDMRNSVVARNNAEFGGGIVTFGSLNPVTMVISNSVISDNVAAENGGGLANGNDNLSIYGSTFANNIVNDGVGGGIHNTGGNIEIVASRFEGNRAQGTAFGGGAISNVTLGEINMRGSLILNNSTVGRGGGLFTGLAPFNVFDSLIAGNSADNGGGGLYVQPSNVQAFTLQRTTVANNFSNTFGGGALFEGNLTTSRIVNSTFTGNRATTLGGGIALNSGGLVELIHSTVADNDTTTVTNGIGGTNFFAGTATVGGSIIANNATGDCSATNGSTSLGFNVSPSPSAGFPTPDRWCSFMPLQAGDLPDTDPLLGALANNGNIGSSYRLQPGSPAIDIVTGNCPPELNGVDGRGVPRPAGSCDAGAVSDENVNLPLVYFRTAATVFNDEGTSTGAQVVELVIDNTSGTFNAPTTVPLTVYVTQIGSAADSIDFNATQAPPSTFTFGAGTFPAPGTSATLTFSFEVLDDLLPEGDETVALTAIVTGPGVLDAARSTHLVTIIDDDLPPVVQQAPPIAAAGDGDAGDFALFGQTNTTDASDELVFCEDVDVTENPDCITQLPATGESPLWRAVMQASLRVIGF